MNILISDLRSLLPKPVRRWMVRHTRLPRVGGIDFGDLRRLRPISHAWGGDRGTPVDRHYIEQFLDTHCADVRGRVLEIGDDSYTRRFGGTCVGISEVLHAAPGNPLATYVADLANAPQIPSNRFDCMICTQTLHVIADMPAAMATIHRILRPGGVLLATFPGISRVYQDAEGRWADYWRVTAHSARRLALQNFDEADVHVRVYGNVLSATAFLHGVAAEELTATELDYYDELYPVTVGLRAVKAADR